MRDHYDFSKSRKNPYAKRLKKQITIMSSQTLGENISQPEVTNVSSHGVWLLCGNKELFMSYEDFPWFKDVPVGKILNVKEVSPGHLFWPDLDVDIGIETIEHPERFPLKAK